MHRVDHNTRLIDGNGTGKDGFTEGAPGTTAATRITDDWLNDTQEEICSVIESTDTLIKGDQDQLYTSLRKWFSFLQLSNISRQTQASAYTGDFRAIANAGLVYVAVGTAAEIQSMAPSSTGSTWYHRSAAGAYSGTFYAAALIPFLSKWMIAGETGEIETASNPTTWSKQTPGGSYTDTFRGIACSDTAAVIVGTGGQIQRTIDGTTFTVEKNSGYDFYSVAYNPTLHRFVAVGGTAAIFTSDDDGDTWTSRTPAGGYANAFNSVIYNSYDGKFYAGGGSGAAEIQSSTNGITWARETISTSDPVVALLAMPHVLLAVCGGTVYVKNRTSWQPFYKWISGVPNLYYAACFESTYEQPWFAGYAGGLYCGLAFNLITMS